MKRIKEMKPTNTNITVINKKVIKNGAIMTIRNYAVTFHAYLKGNSISAFLLKEVCLTMLKNLLLD